MLTLHDTAWLYIALSISLQYSTYNRVLLMLLISIWQPGNSPQELLHGHANQACRKQSQAVCNIAMLVAHLQHAATVLASSDRHKAPAGKCTITQACEAAIVTCRNDPTLYIPDEGLMQLLQDRDDGVMGDRRQACLECIRSWSHTWRTYCNDKEVSYPRCYCARPL
jgi:hypothetical protein